MTPCVLVVDDEAVIRQFVRRVLEGLSFRVEEAADGEEGLELIRTVRPDVVLLDMMMPKLNGLDLLVRLRAEGEAGGPTPKIVMLTAVDDPDTENKAVEAGATTYLTKPFSPTQLLDTIEGLIDS